MRDWLLEKIRAEKAYEDADRALTDAQFLVRPYAIRSRHAEVFAVRMSFDNEPQVYGDAASWSSDEQENAADQAWSGEMEDSVEVEADGRSMFDHTLANPALDGENLDEAGFHLSSQLDGEYVYHATTQDALEDIAVNGLLPHEPWHGTDQDSWPDGSIEPRVYFAKSEQIAQQFSPLDRGPPAMLRARSMDVPGLQAERGTPDLVTEQTVPAKALEVLIGGEWLPLADANDGEVRAFEDSSVVGDES